MIFAIRSVEFGGIFLIEARDHGRALAAFVADRNKGIRAGADVWTAGPLQTLRKAFDMRERFAVVTVRDDDGRETDSVWTVQAVEMIGEAVPGPFVAAARLIALAVQRAGWTGGNVPAAVSAVLAANPHTFQTPAAPELIAAARMLAGGIIAADVEVRQGSRSDSRGPSPEALAAARTIFGILPDSSDTSASVS